MRAVSNNTTEADICLVLDSRFPCTTNQALSAAHEIVTGFSEKSFAIIYLATSDADTDPFSKSLPDNVTHLECHNILAPVEKPIEHQRHWFRTRQKKQAFAVNDMLHKSLRDGVTDNNVVAQFAEVVMGAGALDEHDLRQHRKVWQSIHKQYKEAPQQLDIEQYFWTVRSMHVPLFVLARIAEKAPQAKCYHGLSMGYAGFLGALIKQNTGLPLLLSEHYQHEQPFSHDVAPVNWIPTEYDPFETDASEPMRYLRRVWIRFFKSLAGMAEKSSNEVFNIGRDTRPSKVNLISNGSDVVPFFRTAYTRYTSSVGSEEKAS